MNLRPPAPPGYRYFRFFITIIVVWLLHLGLFAGWLWMEQHAAVDRSKKASAQATLAQIQSQKKVKDHQDFLAEYGPLIQYRTSVEQLDGEGVIWTQALGMVKESLPAGTTLFQAEAIGNRFDGWAIFSTAREAATFMDRLKKNKQVQGAFLDCLGTHCTENPPPIQAEQQVAHFHFSFAPTQNPSSPTTEGRENAP